MKAIRRLQKCGHLPADASIFKSYCVPGNFIDVRLAALEALVDFTKGSSHTLVDFTKGLSHTLVDFTKGLSHTLVDFTKGLLYSYAFISMSAL